MHPIADIFETAAYTDGTGCPIGFTSVNEGGRPVQCLKVKVRRPPVLAALGCENLHLGFSSTAPAWPLPAYRSPACLACSPAWTPLPPSWRPGATPASRAPPPSSPSRLAAVLARDGRQLARVCTGAGAACEELNGACAPACISLHTPAALLSRHLVWQVGGHHLRPQARPPLHIHDQHPLRCAWATGGSASLCRLLTSLGCPSTDSASTTLIRCSQTCIRPPTGGASRASFISCHPALCCTQPCRHGGQQEEGSSLHHVRPWHEWRWLVCSHCAGLGADAAGSARAGARTPGRPSHDPRLLRTPLPVHAATTRAETMT